MSIYRTYLTAWSDAAEGSTLVEVADARDSNFGEQLLTAFKAHARITYTYDDTLLPTYIDAAIMHIEQQLEFPILPRTFDWDVGENTGYDQYEVPLRNADAVGQKYDFEPLRAKCIIATPTAWPVTLVVGFDAATDIPADLRLEIFNLAATLEQLRSTAELSAADLSQTVVARYGVMRC